MSAHAYVTELGDINIRAEDVMDPRGFNDVLVAYGAGDVVADLIAANINRLLDAGVLTVNMSARYRTV